jgi:hypothetical protein
MNKQTIVKILLLQAAVLFQVGCSDQPYEMRQPDTNDLPGLFSGEKGYFEIELDR